MAIYLGNTKVNATAGTSVTASITVDQSYDATSTNAQSGTAVAEAIADLDATVSGTGAGKTLSTLSETDGKISATFQDISITTSQISDFPSTMPPSSHTHGNITNTGDITTNVAIASGDRLVINDESESKINNSSITFGTSTTTFLNNSGAWSTPAKGATATYTQKLNKTSATDVSASGTSLGSFKLSAGKHIVQANVTISGTQATYNVLQGAYICTSSSWTNSVASQVTNTTMGTTLNLIFIVSLSAETTYYLVVRSGMSNSTATGYVRDINLT